jgi:hypothetical protein
MKRIIVVAVYETYIDEEDVQEILDKDGLENELVDAFCFGSTIFTQKDVYTARTGVNLNIDGFNVVMGC